MKLENVTHPELELSWEKLDTAWKGGKSKIEYCADGDGFVVIRETTEGFKLFDQADYVCRVDGTLVDALQFAEDYMLKNGYEEMHEHCKSYV